MGSIIFHITEKVNNQRWLQEALMGIDGNKQGSGNGNQLRQLFIYFFFTYVYVCV